MTDPVQKAEKHTWILEDGQLIKKQITFTPLIYQIVEEMLMAAASGDATIVKVTIDDAIIKVSSEGGGLPDLRDSHFSLTGFKAEKVEHGKVTKWRGSKQSTINIENPATPKSTMITFIPHSKCLQDDTLAFIKRRVVDLAGCCSGVKVELEGTRRLPSTFQDYIQLYLETVTHDTRMICEKVDSNWEICVALGDGLFEQVSFMKDESHVNHITTQITTYLAKAFQLEPTVIQKHIWVFVNAPSFYSTRDNLTGTSESSSCHLSAEFLFKIAESHLINDQLTVSKLSDAPLANTVYVKHATLIVVEGDSAKSFPMSGLPIIGTSKYGVFPVSGKFLNVRKANRRQVEDNVELQNIKKIIGLVDGRVYNDDNVKELRYGHLMIMADQNGDGTHIKGLLINFIECYWPELLRVEGFLQFFVTPIIKATHHEDNSELFFYTMDEYLAWTGVQNQYDFMYYKGLASIEKEEGTGFFKESHKYIKDVVSRAEDCDNIRRILEVLFSGKMADERKKWLDTPGEPQDNFDPNKTTIYMVDFLQKDYKHFAREFLFRSLPSSIDGFKPTQRRIFYGATMTLFSTPCLPVDVFTAYVARLTAYYHGIANLVDATLRMCNDYVGTNNINLILPVGQVGSRKEVSEKSRYGSTKLSSLTKYIFHKADEGVLKYLEALGQRVEPEWFIPIIPMLLVNGSYGIGFGWKSDILNYSPREIIKNLLLKLGGLEPVTMLPYYKGCDGTISNNRFDTRAFDIEGEVIPTQDALTLRITKVGLTTPKAYHEEFLKSAAPETIQGYTVCDDNTDGLFEVTMTQDQMNKAQRQGIHKWLKLSITKNIRNMNAFDEKGILRKHATPTSVLLHFFDVRLDYYAKRRIYMLHNLKKDELILKNKLDYIEAVDGGLSLLKLSMKGKIAKLKASGLQTITLIEKEVLSILAREKIKEEQEIEEEEDDEKGYQYLLDFNYARLTDEDIKELKKDMNEKREQFDKLKNATIEDLWSAELKALDDQLASKGYPAATF